MIFYREYTDGTTIDCSGLVDSCVGGHCWLIGSGAISDTEGKKALELLPYSPHGIFAVNNSCRHTDGYWRIKPHYVTTYDDSRQLPSSTWEDPSITKFVLETRKREWIGSRQVRECPNVVLFRNEPRNYYNFLDPSSDKINNSCNSFVQALDIGYRLGYRTFHLLGTPFKVPDVEGCPLEAEVAKQGMKSDLLKHRLEAYKGDQADAGGDYPVYSFGETKPLARAKGCDENYWKITQYLRQARPCLERLGVKIINHTPNSRLEPWFPYEEPVLEIPSHEMKGVYARRKDELMPYWKDIEPYTARPKNTTNTVIKQKDAIAPMFPDVKAWVEQAQGVTIAD